MRELLDVVAGWHASGLAVALARVVAVEGSSPRGPGAALAVNERGEVTGSVSGGCVESAVVTEAAAVLASGSPRRVRFGAGDDAFSVGLTCGGTVDVYIERLVAGDEVLDGLRRSLQRDRPVALVTVVDGDSRLRLRGLSKLVRPDDAVRSFGDADLDRAVIRDARGLLAAGRSGLRRYGPHGEARGDAMTVFVQSWAPPPQLLVFGATDFTAALVRVAKVLGYRVTVCDAREVFTTPARFPEADAVVVDWPDRLLARVGSTLTPRDAVCVLSHEARFDVPALVAALRTDAGYVGAMGSRRTHDERLRRLKETGLDDDELARLHSPIGLDLGARTPEETAISICAELIATRTPRATVHPLTHTLGPIHS